MRYLPVNPAMVDDLRQVVAIGPLDISASCIGRTCGGANFHGFQGFHGFHAPNLYGHELTTLL